MNHHTNQTKTTRYMSNSIIEARQDFEAYKEFSGQNGDFSISSAFRNVQKLIDTLAELEAYNQGIKFKITKVEGLDETGQTSVLYRITHQFEKEPENTAVHIGLFPGTNISRWHLRYIHKPKPEFAQGGVIIGDRERVIMPDGNPLYLPTKMSIHDL